MPHVTEAACLVESGSSFPMRRGYRLRDGSTIFLGVRAGAFSIYRDDEPIHHYDLDGRWQRGYVGGRHYLKDLDGSTWTLDRSRESSGVVLGRDRLSDLESITADENARLAAADLLERLDRGVDRLDPPSGSRPLGDDDARVVLTRAAGRDAASWVEHRARFDAVYRSTPFVPAVAANPIVVELTTGAGCFGFGEGESKSSHIRSPDEFARHVGDVADFLGRRALQGRQLFLAGGDALGLGVDRVIEAIEVARASFPIRPRGTRRPRTLDPLRAEVELDGVETFVTDFDQPLTAVGWSRLAAAGLDRVVFGVESGSPAIRAAYGRSWTNEAFLQWVELCPVAVGLVVVVGAGGDEHVAATADLVAAAGLPAGTIIELMDAADLDPGTSDAQRIALKTMLDARLVGRGVKVMPSSPGRIRR